MAVPPYLRPGRSLTFRAPLLAAALLSLASAACVPRASAAARTASSDVGESEPGAGDGGLADDDTGGDVVDPTETGAGALSSGSGPAATPDPLAGPEDDFAALAYALHGMEDEAPEAEEDAAHPAHGPEHEHESDDIETPAEWTPPAGTVKSPIADLGAEEIRRRLKDDPASLGSMSIGPPNRGALFNGVQMPLGDRWTMTDPGNAYGTREAIDQLIRCIDSVHEKYPGSPKMIVGHWSSRRGGRLRPHKSHQSGRDVDVSYFYTTPTGWYAHANAKNLDRPRTWAFVKALLTKADVEMILIDTSLQRLLREHAIAAGEDRAFVDRVFQVSGERHGFAPIRHASGHATHIHIRFRSPEAVASGKIAEAYLPRPAAPRERGNAKRAVASNDRASGKPGSAAAKSAERERAPKDTTTYVTHRARSGDTLDSLARRYGTTVAAIRQANGIKGNAIKAKRTYKIPVTKPGGKPAAGSGRAASKRKG